MTKITACKVCGRNDLKLSRNRLCPNCGEDRVRRSISQMQNREGEIYDIWVQKTINGMSRKRKQTKEKQHK